jgi:hypothetical protein
MAPVEIEFNLSPKKIYSTNYHYNFIFLLKKEKNCPHASVTTRTKKKKKKKKHPRIDGIVSMQIQK